jgi:hypothetical protein
MQRSQDKEYGTQARYAVSASCRRRYRVIVLPPAMLVEVFRGARLGTSAT